MHALMTSPTTSTPPAQEIEGGGRVLLVSGLPEQCHTAHSMANSFLSEWPFLGAAVGLTTASGLSGMQQSGAMRLGVRACDPAGCSAGLQQPTQGRPSKQL